MSTKVPTPPPPESDRPKSLPPAPPLPHESFADYQKRIGALVKTTRPIGPNVIQLIVHKMCVDTIPPDGGVAGLLNLIRSKEQIRDAVKKAAAWVFTVIDLVKAAPDGSQFGDDEAIASEILRQVDERLIAAKQQKSPPSAVEQNPPDE